MYSKAECASALPAPTHQPCAISDARTPRAGPGDSCECAPSSCVYEREREGKEREGAREIDSKREGERGREGARVGVEVGREREREREKEKERERKKERAREREREREREKEREKHL